MAVGKGGNTVIHIAQIGMAHDHAEGYMESLRRCSSVFHVVGIAEDNPEHRRNYGSRACYQGIPLLETEALLNTPGLQAVMVETEEGKLVETAGRCVDRGLHVHMDKPGGTDIAVFERLLQAAQAKRRILRMGYMYRYNPAVIRCLDLVRSGRLGEIYRVDATMNTYLPAKKRAWLNPFPGGNMFYLGCHMIDLVMQIQGIPDSILPMNRRTGCDGVEAVDQAMALLQYQTGVSVVQASAVEVNGFGRRRVVVCGSRGTVEIQPLEGDVHHICPSMSVWYAADATDTPYESVPARREYFAPCPGRYDDMLLDFAAEIRGEKDTPYSYDYELQLQKAVLAACGEREVTWR